jgi:hypothetical protein
MRALRFIREGRGGEGERMFPYEGRQCECAQVEDNRRHCGEEKNTRKRQITVEGHAWRASTRDAEMNVARTAPGGEVRGEYLVKLVMIWCVLDLHFNHQILFACSLLCF